MRSGQEDKDGGGDGGGRAKREHGIPPQVGTGRMRRPLWESPQHTEEDTSISPPPLHMYFLQKLLGSKALKDGAALQGHVHAGYVGFQALLLGGMCGYKKTKTQTSLLPPTLAGNMSSVILGLKGRVGQAWLAC